MSIYKINNQKLEPVLEKKIDLERDIQQLTEKNLDTIFGYQFISSEFQLHNLRIDTLAFDKENKSFIIIEFKRDRSFSIIDQGYAYLGLMLNNKADFILEYNEKMHGNLKRDDVDWSQSRVIFVANSFTTYQQSAISFKDLPIELWEVKTYENNFISYNQLKSPDSNESIKTVSNNQTVTAVSKEIKNYTIEEHFKNGWDKPKEIFDLLNEGIINLDSRIEVRPVKYYIGYRVNNKNLIGVRIYKIGPCVTFTRSEPKDFHDPEKRVTYVKDSVKYYNQHQSTFQLKTIEDVDYAMFLIKQAQKRFEEKF